MAEKAEKSVAAVHDKNGNLVREYSREDHGAAFEKLAHEFIAPEHGKGREGFTVRVR